MEYLRHQDRQTLAQEFLAAVAGLVDEPSQAKGVVEEVMALDLDHLAELSVQPGAVAWQRARSAAARGRKIHAVDGRPMTARPEYLAALLARTRGDLARLAIVDDELWLRSPFGDAVFFEEAAVSAKARPVVAEI